MLSLLRIHPNPIVRPHAHCIRDHTTVRYQGRNVGSKLTYGKPWSEEDALSRIQWSQWQWHETTQVWVMHLIPITEKLRKNWSRSDHKKKAKKLLFLLFCQFFWQQKSIWWPYLELLVPVTLKKIDAKTGWLTALLTTSGVLNGLGNYYVLGPTLWGWTQICTVRHSRFWLPEN